MIEKEIADMLDGLEYGEEIRDDILKYAKENGAVIVFGASDDLMKFRGAITGEVSVVIGDTCVYIDKNGLLENKCDNKYCPYFIEKRLLATYIMAVWDSNGYSWIYITTIPHETFDILEVSAIQTWKKYCRGIVFSIDKI